MRRLVALVGLAALGLTACAAEPLVPVPYRSAVPAADQASIASEAAATTAATASAESVAPAETQAPVDECRALAESLPVEVLAGQVGGQVARKRATGRAASGPLCAAA